MVPAREKAMELLINTCRETRGGLFWPRQDSKPGLVLCYLRRRCLLEAGNSGRKAMVTAAALTFPPSRLRWVQSCASPGSTRWMASWKRIAPCLLRPYLFVLSLRRYVRPYFLFYCCVDIGASWLKSLNKLKRLFLSAF